MSLLGGIGNIMTGSGLQEVLECVYASYTVGHMVNGKAIARALRVHILVSGALMLCSHRKSLECPCQVHSKLLNKKKMLQ